MRINHNHDNKFKRRRQKYQNKEEDDVYKLMEKAKEKWLKLFN